MPRYIRPARHWQDPKSPIRVAADEAIPVLTRRFAAVLKSAKRLLDAGRTAELISAGLYTEVWRTIDWNHQNQAMREPMGLLGDLWMRCAQVGAMQINGKLAAAGLRVRAGQIVQKDNTDFYAFDRFNPQTQAAIRAYQDELIRELGQSSRDAIEQTVLASLRAGEGPDEIAEDIRAVIGLTRQQAAAVLRFRAELKALDASSLDRVLLSAADKALVRGFIAAGQPIDAETLALLTDNYERAYVNYRARTIATTEATRASSMGLVDSYRQADARGLIPASAVTKHWRVTLDERLCPICLGIIDKYRDGVPLNAPFGQYDAPPAHVGCRCSVELVTDLDQLATAVPVSVVAG